MLSSFNLVPSQMAAKVSGIGPHGTAVGSYFDAMEGNHSKRKEKTPEKNQTQKQVSSFVFNTEAIL